MVPRLGELLKERGVRSYSGKRKAELLAMLQASDPQPQTWEPHPTRWLHLHLSQKPPKKRIKQLERQGTHFGKLTSKQPEITRNVERRHSKMIKKAPTKHSS